VDVETLLVRARSVSTSTEFMLDQGIHAYI
jgi:hypothetical protein